MRLIKWILIFGLITGLFYGWNRAEGGNPIAPLMVRAQEILSFRSHVTAKLDRKNFVPLAQVPLVFQQSLIAIEDYRFYQHFGVDIEAIFRATLVNLQSGELKEGGSTITQQLVKNLFLSQDRTFSRKAMELPLTLLMEAHFTKEEILEMYVNTIYFGSGAYGIGEAAQTYFGKTPRALTLPEASLIAGLTAAPSLYSPLVDLPLALARQKAVLTAMVRHGYIGPQQAEDARNVHLKFAR